MSEIVRVVKEAGAKLVLVGDPAQLQPIGPGAPFRAISERVGFVALEQIQRQQNTGDRAASIALAQGKIEQALGYYQQQGRLCFTRDSDSAIEQLICDWQHGLESKSLPQRLILAHRNRDVDAINLAARDALKAQGLIGAEDHLFATEKEALPVAVGERLLFLKNDRTLGVFNGEFATLTAFNNDQLTVQKDDGQSLSFSTQVYNQFSYGYAATVHKAQGSTKDQVYVYAGGKYWNQHLAYVALTRHRESVKLYAARSEHASFKTLVNRFSRAEIRDNVIDFPLSFAIRRGFDPNSMLGKFIDKIGAVKEKIFDQWLFVSNIEAYLEKRILNIRQDLSCIRHGFVRDVAKYCDYQQQLKTRWRSMKRDLLPGDNIYHHPHYADYYKTLCQRDALAAHMLLHLTPYEKVLQRQRIELASLHKAAKSHKSLQLIERYQGCEDITRRDRLAAAIVANKACYPHVYQQDIDWRKLHQQKESYHEQQLLQIFDRNERKAYRLVKAYQRSVRDTAKAWQQYARIKNQRTNHACHHLQLCKRLTEQRNRLAYDVTLGAEHTMEHLSPEKTNWRRLTKHANHHRWRHLKESQLSHELLYRVPEKLWQQLSSVKHSKASLLKQYYQIAKREKATIARDSEFQDFHNQLKSALEHEDFRQSLRKHAPQLSTALKKQVPALYAQARALSIDWLNRRYTKEWERLSHIKDPRVQYFVSCYQDAKQAQTPDKRRTHYRTLNNTAIGLINNKALANQLGKLAPKLGFRMQAQSHAHSRIRGLERTL